MKGYNSILLEVEMVFQSRESTALIWVLFLQTHPLSLSLSLSLRIPRIPLRLWHLPHTTWFDEGNSLEHAFREWENGPKKRGGEREKQRALLFLPATGSWSSSHPTKQTPTPATNRPNRRQRITRSSCVPYSHLPTLIPSSGFFSNLERVWKGSTSRSVSVQE